jgi:hypothetical protein
LFKDELERSIPKSSFPAAALQSDPIILNLRKLLEQIELLKKDMNSIGAKMRSTAEKDDICKSADQTYFSY